MDCPYTFDEGIITGFKSFPKLYYVTQKSTGKLFIVKLLSSIREITEVSILSTLRSDNLLHLTDILTTQNCNDINYGTVGAIVPIAPSSLQPYLGKNRWELIFQSIYGIAQLHNLGYLHLDLKAENILVFNLSQGLDERENQIAKVADFGSSVFVGDVMKPIQMSTQFKGTQTYLSPNRLTLLKNNINTASLSYVDDIYALAILMIYNVIGTDTYLFKKVKSIEELSIEIKNMVENVESLLLNKSYDPLFISMFVSLIKKMTRENPITAQEVLFDPFFLSVRQSQYRSFVFFPPLFEFDYLTEEEKKIDISNELKLVINRLKVGYLQRRYPSLAFDILVRVLIRKKMKDGEMTNSSLSKYIDGAIEIAYSFYSYLPQIYDVYGSPHIISEEINLLKGAIFRKGLYYARLSIPQIDFLIQNFTISEYEELIVSLNIS